MSDVQCLNRRLIERMLSPRLYTGPCLPRFARTPSRTSGRIRIVLTALLLCVALTGYAADWSEEPVPRRLVAGESIAAVLEELRASGVPLAYSSALVPAGLRIVSAPRSRNLLAAVREILRAHDLTLFAVDGVYVVGHQAVSAASREPGTVLIHFRDAQSDAVVTGARVSGLPESAIQTNNRSERSLAINVPAGEYPVVVTAPGYKILEATISAASEETRTATLRLLPLETPLTEVVVAASRYELLRDAIDNPSGLDRTSIMQTPDTGDDPIRAVQRLPGTTSGASAQPHLRGGSTRETGIVLDGHRLLNPFHVRDYQSLFSAIDVRAINGIEVYTGDFPVRYGDLTGGLVLVDTLTPDEDIRNEFGLSVFNASILSAGQLADGAADYVLSIRRGNLDLILNEEIGEPAYYDVYSKMSYRPSPDTTLAANLMIVKDSVIIIPAADIDEREQTTNDTRNSQFWLSWEQQWTDALSSLTVLSASDSISGRHALVSDPEKITGSLSDERTITIVRLNQDWRLDLNERHLLGWGAEFQQVDADYNYRSTVDYYGIYQDLPDRSNAQSRAVLSSVDGDAMAFYASDRWMVNRRLIADLGIRWDKQSYTDTDDNGQFSPRASLLYRLNPRTNLRLSWGRYYQSQGAHELQVEDGVTNFFPAQRFDQSIFGIDYQLNAHYSFRTELYVKTSKSIRPHFENMFDPLSVVPELEPDRVVIAPQRADLRGLEISAAYEGDNGFDWWASYTLSKADDVVSGQTIARSWDQRHAGQIGVALSGDRWSFSAAAKVHSGWPMTRVYLSADDTGHAVIFGERNEARYRDYFSLDMRVDYRRPTRFGYFSWYFEVSNSTNRENPCCVDFDVATDTAGNRVLDQSFDYWFPLLPATGILLEF